MDNELVIVRTFAASLKRLWQAWTDPELRKRWGPQDFATSHIESDFRPEGWFLHCIRGSVGPGQQVRNFCGTGTFKEVVPFEKLVIAMSFADEKGRPVPASYYNLPGDWPMEFMLYITFEEAGDGVKLRLRQTDVPSEAMELARLGWEQSLDKLSDVLKC